MLCLILARGRWPFSRMGRMPGNGFQGFDIGRDFAVLRKSFHQGSSDFWRCFVRQPASYNLPGAREPRMVITERLFDVFLSQSKPFIWVGQVLLTQASSLGSEAVRWHAQWHPCDQPQQTFAKDWI